MPSIVPLKLYRVEAPVLPPSVGQGEPAGGVMFARDGFEPVTIPYGTVVKASATCDGDRGIANMEAEGTPLVRVHVLEQLSVTAL